MFAILAMVEDGGGQEMGVPGMLGVGCRKARGEMALGSGDGEKG